MNIKKITIAIMIMILITLILLILILAINKNNEYNLSNNIENNNYIYNEIENIVENDYISNEAENTVENYMSNEIVDYNIIETNQKIEESSLNKVKYVDNRKEYFTVKGIVTKYIELLGDKNSTELINLMSPAYLQEFNITENNINYNVPEKENYTEMYYIDIINMFEVQISDKTKIYIVQGNISIKYEQEKYPLNIIVEADTVNLLYNIYPSEYISKYNLIDIKEGDIIEFKENGIENRNNLNKYSYTKIDTDQYVVNSLFDDFIYKLRMDTKEAYLKLNTQYTEKTFTVFESFNKYLNTIKNKLNFLELMGYTVNSSEEYTDYICTDQYNNYYIFRQQNGIMNYTVFLDSYTVELEYFKEIYDKADINTRLGIQIDKFKQMINLKDYSSVYNKLNIVFKNNNFINVSNLETHLKNNIYNINHIEINDIQKKEDYYICNCSLINLENENENKNMNIILKLIDSNNFEMSFSFE